MDSGINGVTARVVLGLAAAGFLAAVVILLTWGRSVDLPDLFRGLRLAHPYTSRGFFGQQCVFIGLFFGVMAPFAGSWPLSALALALTCLSLLGGLRLQEGAERSGVAAEERRLHDRYVEKLAAMSPLRRFAWRFGLLLAAVAGATLLAAFRRLGTPG